MKIPNNLLLRSISTLVMLPCILAILYADLMIIFAFILIMALISGYELNNLIKHVKNKLHKTIPALYIYVALISMAMLAYKDIRHFHFLIFSVWAVDVGAYALGKALGGPKIMPKISPNKTYAGLLGALLSAMAVAHFFAIDLIYGALIAIIAQAGDFLQSWYKRRAGISDSSSLIPGHGGLLDRIDGLMLVMIIFNIFRLL